MEIICLFNCREEAVFFQLNLLFSGEILIPSVVETPPSPSLKKSRSFTSGIEIVLKSPKSQSRDSSEGKEGSLMDNVEQTVDSVDKREDNELEVVEGEKTTPEEPQVFETVVLRNKSEGIQNPRAKHYGKSKSACEGSHSDENTEEVDSRHQKSLSDPVKKADEERERRKLMEYQKWQKYGRRGKPPGDLKISE